MASPPQHLDLAKLKAFAARMATAIVLDGLPSEEVGEEAARAHLKLLQRMCDDADALAQGSGPLDTSLKGFSRRWTRPEAGRPPALQQRMRELSRRIGRINCERCAGDKTYVCRGAPAHDDAIIARGGECIEPLKTLATLVEQWSGRLYASAGHPITPPRILISTSNAHPHADRDLLGSFFVSGWHEVADERHVPASVVGVNIREWSFDWRALCGMFYILAHEMICHGFQGINRGLAITGSQRETAAKECPWSEGWMDRLAFELAKDWLQTRRKRLPDWLAKDPITVQTVTEDIHDARYKPGGDLKAGAAQARNMGRYAFISLRDAFESASPLDEHAVTRFSLCLNLHHLSETQRADCAVQIYRVVRSADPKRRTALLDLCNELVEHDDVLGFLDALARLAHPPPQVKTLLTIPVK